MPAAVLPPQKRALADSTKAHRNANLPLTSPSAAKRRKLEVKSSPTTKAQLSQNGVKMGSSQPAKSQFEEEVLEKLTQDISGLKERNSEKDQEWQRPSLDDFDPGKDSLCFQQIDVEEGTLHGESTTIKLFGVTEVSPSCHSFPKTPIFANSARRVILFSSMSRDSFTTSTSLRQYPSRRRTAAASRHI